MQQYKVTIEANVFIEKLVDTPPVKTISILPAAREDKILYFVGDESIRTFEEAKQKALKAAVKEIIERHFKKDAQNIFFEHLRVRKIIFNSGEWIAGEWQETLE